MTFEQWQQFSRDIHQRAEALQASKRERLVKECEKHGLDYACIHNAAIDTNLVGWCFNNPTRLEAAKRINHEREDYSINNRANRIINRAWNTVQR